MAARRRQELADLEIPPDLLVMWAEFRKQWQVFLSHFLDGMAQADAYQIAFPDCKSRNAASASSTRLLRKAKISAFVAKYRQWNCATMPITSPEVLQFCAEGIRLDHDQLFDDHGNVRREYSQYVQGYKIERRTVGGGYDEDEEETNPSVEISTINVTLVSKVELIKIVCALASRMDVVSDELIPPEKLAEEIVATRGLPLKGESEEEEEKKPKRKKRRRSL